MVRIPRISAPLSDPVNCFTGFFDQNAEDMRVSSVVVELQSGC